jgi:hypothetical protein
MKNGRKNHGRTIKAAQSRLIPATGADDNNAIVKRNPLRQGERL